MLHINYSVAIFAKGGFSSLIRRTRSPRARFHGHVRALFSHPHPLPRWLGYRYSLSLTWISTRRGIDTLNYHPCRRMRGKRSMYHRREMYFLLKPCSTFISRCWVKNLILNDNLKLISQPDALGIYSLFILCIHHDSSAF